MLKYNSVIYMQIVELILIGLSLTMDAFAISICEGIKEKKFIFKNALIVALFFGVFQAGMPLIGFYVGSLFANLITSIDHWVAFVLLTIIGAKMVYDGIKGEDVKTCYDEKTAKLNYKVLTILAIATSIDALAVGISFAFTDTNIYLAILIIGVITFIFSFIGVSLGQKLGTKFSNKAAIVGGIVLFLVGLKILLEHLGILVSTFVAFL